MPTQANHRFNVAEYHRMGEIGVLLPDAQVELLDGVVYDRPPIGPFHGGVTGRLIGIFATAARNRWITNSQTPVHLNDHSEPQPDLAVLKPASDAYTTHHPHPEDVFLLIEIADSSLAADQEIKLPAYGRAGIAEVWIVNLVEQTIEVYREPNFSGYGVKSVLRSGDQARPQAFPDVAVDVATLLKR